MELFLNNLHYQLIGFRKCSKLFLSLHCEYGARHDLPFKFPLHSSEFHNIPGGGYCRGCRGLWGAISSRASERRAYSNPLSAHLVKH